MAGAGPLTDELGWELTAWGKVVTLQTRGRMTSRPVRAAVGFVEDPDGSIRVAAGDERTHWARNLEVDGRCQVTLGDRTWAAGAERLDGAEHARTIADLILRYGTPAERLGRGPSFRLRPIGGQAPAGVSARGGR